MRCSQIVTFLAVCCKGLICLIHSHYKILAVVIRIHIGTKDIHKIVCLRIIAERICLFRISKLLVFLIFGACHQCVKVDILLHQLPAKQV